MGIAGIPWWTTDIGGFHGGNPKDPAFKELLIRWFEYGTFCPVMRLHGYREPLKEAMGTEGGAACVSGADNEVWSFGEEAYEICKTYLEIREAMKLYITELMKAAHLEGTPVIRPLFYDFPKDSKSWEVEDEYMFGPDVLVAPILYADMRKRSVYLPEGSDWENYWTREVLKGGRTIEVDAPLDKLPVFTRNNRRF
jgi:alpha-D-xyloside xylohydrolase